MAWRLTGCPAGWRPTLCLALAHVLLAGMLVAPTAAEDSASARGRRLFETGIGKNGHAIEAVFANSGTPIPGTLLSCAGCHGKDGKGQSVRGINPPDITWQNLTKPYPVQVGAARSRLPYTDALVLRAVTTGRDSSNQVLAQAMPRFRLAPGDAADLVAYMRELGSRPDPGVSADAISIGVLVPPREQSPGADDAIRNVLGAYGDELNRSGGIFGRRIEFAFLEAGPGTDFSHSSPHWRALEQAVLAVAVSDGVAEHELALLTRQRDLPLVAIRADRDLSPARNVFYLAAGATGELGALTTQAARQVDAGSARLAVVCGDKDQDRDRLEVLRPRIDHDGWGTIAEIVLPGDGPPDDLPEQALRRIESSDAILFAGWDRRFAKILSRLGQADRTPLVLLAGSLTSPKSLPHDISARIRIRFAFEFADPWPDSAEVPEKGVSPRAADAALAAAKVLVEGLRRAGRAVSRARLIDAVETIQRFDAGYGPPLSYAPRQHVGFNGAQIVPFDPQRLRPMEPGSRVQLQ